MAKVPYASAIGSLMYVMVCTRPDIAQAVGAVSRYMNNPENYIGKRSNGSSDICGVLRAKHFVSKVEI